MSDACRKFYAQFNNIMSVLGKCSREMSAMHLIKAYCLPTMLYGCEMWTLSDSSSHRSILHGTTVLHEFWGI